MRNTTGDRRPAAVPEAKQAGENHPRDWKWVERSVWTEQMLEALHRGVKGGVWFSLIDKVFRLRTLRAAWKRVRANKGAAGVDHVSVEKFEERLEENLLELHRELAEGTYRPRSIRRHYIDKPGRQEKRPLGIPVVRDRVVQTAIKLVIEPIFEKQFSERSFGFRPGRGCHDAIARVEELLEAGATFVVDADFRSFFDSIEHPRLMELLRERICDGKLLRLIEMFLTQEILEPMGRWSPERGAPQGAVLSPLLANVYLHPLDRLAEEAGLQMVRYADDQVILCHTLPEAQQALALLESFCKSSDLSLHPDKTRLADATTREGFEFLGYHFGKGSKWVSNKSFNKLKRTLRPLTKRCNGHSMEQTAQRVSRILRGWFEYFKYSNRSGLTQVDYWLRRRLRSILRKRSQRRGVAKGLDHHRWPNSYFSKVRLFCLEDAHLQFLQSSTR